MEAIAWTGGWVEFIVYNRLCDATTDTIAFCQERVVWLYSPALHSETCWRDPQNAKVAFYVTLSMSKSLMHNLSPPKAPTTNG